MTPCSRSSSSARAWRLDAAATSEANEILRRHGLPEVNTRVIVTDMDGNARSGFVADAFSEENTELGISDEGVKIALDDGTIIEEFITQLDRTGIQIAALPSETSVKEGEGAPLVGEEAPALPDAPPGAEAPLQAPAGLVPEAGSAPGDSRRRRLFGDQDRAEAGTGRVEATDADLVTLTGDQVDVDLRPDDAAVVITGDHRARRARAA